MTVKIRILPKAGYKTALEAYYGNYPRPWWWRNWFGLLDIYPRAYLEEGVITIQRGSEDDRKLLAHEYGHTLSLAPRRDGADEVGHLPWTSLDIMTGTFLTRWRDTYSLLSAWEHVAKVYV